MKILSWEIPVGKQIVRLILERSEHAPISAKAFSGFDPFSFHRRETEAVGSFGGGQVPVVVADCRDLDFDFSDSALVPDYVYSGKVCLQRADRISQLCDASVYEGQENVYPVFNSSQIAEVEASSASAKFIKLCFGDLSESLIQRLNQIPRLILILHSQHTNRVAEQRAAFHFLMNQDCRIPVIIAQTSLANNKEEEQIITGLDFGSLLLDGFGDGLLMVCIYEGMRFQEYSFR